MAITTANSVLGNRPWFGRLPSTIARLISSSVQPPMPVSRSGVMFDATPENGGTEKDSPPLRLRLATGSPVGDFGVWQLPQPRIDSTR